MHWGFYLTGFLIIAETLHILLKKEYLYTRGGYLFFSGIWITGATLFFLVYGDIKNWQHWIGFVIYLIIAMGFWFVCKKGKPNQNSIAKNKNDNAR